MLDNNSKFTLQHLSSIKPCLNKAWRWNNVFPKSGVAFVYGASAAGKTFLMVHVGLAIASGQPVAGKSTDPCGVVYCAAEAGESIKTRISAAEKHIQLPIDTPFSLITVSPNLGANDDDVDELVMAIKNAEEMNGIRYNVIILDTLARVAVGLDENSSKDAGIFIKNADRLARELNALVIVVHHTGKSKEGGMRGSSAFFAAADTVLKIKNSNTYRWAELEKQRDGSDKQGFSFNLESIEIGKDQDGRVVTSCVLNKISDLQKSDAKAIAAKKESRNYQQLMQSLKRCLHQQGINVTLENGSVLKAIESDHVYANYKQAFPKNKDDSNKKGFSRSLALGINQQAVGSEMIEGVQMIWLLGHLT